jgi:hypothetical protein
VSDESKRSRFSRRSLLASLATMPSLFIATRSNAAETNDCDSAAKEAQAALKNAGGTKLVILGTGAGPHPMVPGRTRHMTAHVMASNGAAYVLDCGLGITNLRPHWHSIP